MGHELLPELTRLVVEDSNKENGRLAHVGVLVPWANSMLEAELPSLRLANIVWHYARLAPEDQTTALDDGFLAGLVRAIPAALNQLSRLPLSSVAVGCTSAGFRFPDAIASAVGNAGVPVFTAFDALVATLGRMQAARVVLLTPYPPHLTESEADAFESAGVEVLAHASLGLQDRFGVIAPGEITEMAGLINSAALEAAEAVVLSCTAWPTLAAARTMEHRLGRPVVSSNLALAIHATSFTSPASSL